MLPRKSHINISADTVTLIHIKTEQNSYIYAQVPLGVMETMKDCRDISLQFCILPTQH